MEKKYKTATIRKDLLKARTHVPIGNGYYGLTKALPYRWNNDVFEIYFGGMWQTAQSIDWDF